MAVTRKIPGRQRRWRIVMGLCMLAGAALVVWAGQGWIAARTLNAAMATGRVLEGLSMPGPAPVSGASTGSSAAASARSDAAGAASAAASSGQATWLNDGRPAEWHFAQALALADTGDVDAALARYRSLYDHPALGVAARYNSANVLLREAARLQASQQRDQAVVLAELAKETYRSVLRLRSDHWDARYNLERAQRLQPDPVAIDNEGGEPPGQAERAATTMRGISKGLP